MLTESLQKNGFELCKSDPCVYFNKQTNIIIVTYVDDMLIIGLSLADIYRLQKQLQKQFEMERLGPAKYFLGVRITRNREEGTISLT